MLLWWGKVDSNYKSKSYYYFYNQIKWYLVQNQHITVPISPLISYYVILLRVKFAVNTFEVFPISSHKFNYCRKPYASPAVFITEYDNLHSGFARVYALYSFAISNCGSIYPVIGQNLFSCENNTIVIGRCNFQRRKVWRCLLHYSKRVYVCFYCW